MDTNSITTFAELMEQYGFLIVFGAVMLAAIVVAITLVMNVVNKRESLRLKEQEEKYRLDNELEQKERLDALDRNKQMFQLVTEVQTEQVSQMKGICTVIERVKEELLENNSVVKLSNELSSKATRSVTDLIQKFDSLKTELTSMSAKVDTCCRVNSEILDILKGMDDQRL